jgi:hypothetical protein
MVEVDDTAADRRRREDVCALSQETQAAQFGLELPTGGAVEAEFREYRGRLAVEESARV